MRPQEFQVDHGPAGADADLLRPCRGVEEARTGHQRLGRNACHVDAGAADHAALDHGHPPAAASDIHRQGLPALAPADDQEIHLFGVEVPCPAHDKTRWLVYRARGDGFELADDFVHGDDITPLSVREENGQLIYLDMKQQEVLRRPARAR